MSEIGYPHNRVVANALHNTLESVFGDENWRELSGLLMFSGGLDSTALLVNILEQTNQRLHVHHIEIQNFENRAQAENDAVKKIIAYCKQHYREFSYSTSKFEFEGGGLDGPLALFMAARIHAFLNFNIDIVYSGFVSSPSSAPGAISTGFSHIVEENAVFNACYVNKQYKPVLLRPLTYLKKIDIYESLPPEIAEMTWSCRRPVYKNENYRRCGRCHACQSRSEISKILLEKN